MLSNVVGWGWLSVLHVQFLFFFIKKMDLHRHHAEPNNDISMERNDSSDSDVRKWLHPLMIPLHCL